MGLLDRYLFKQTLFSICIVLGGIAGLLFVTSIADEAARRVNDTYTFTQAVYYVLQTLPSTVKDYISVIVMLGTLISVASLNKHQELTTIRLSAKSSAFLVLRLILPGLILLPVVFIAFEWIAPNLSEHAENTKARLLGSNTPSLTGEWYKLDNQYINIERVTSDSELLGFTRFTINNDNLTSALYSPYVKFIDEEWIANEGIEIQFSSERKTTRSLSNERLIEDRLPLDILENLTKESDELNLSDLSRQITFRERAGILQPELTLIYWNRLFFPIEYVAMLFLALAFSFGSFRRRSIGDAVFKALVVGIVSGLALSTAASALALASIAIPIATLLTKTLFLAAAIYFVSKSY